MTISLHIAGKYQKGLRKVIKASMFNFCICNRLREHCQPLTATCLQISINCNLLSLLRVFISASSSSLNTGCLGQFLLNFLLTSACLTEPYSWTMLVSGPPAQEGERFAWCPRKPEDSSVLSSARDMLTFLMPPFPHIWIENNFAKHPEVPGERIKHITPWEKEMPKCDTLNDCSIYTFETSATKRQKSFSCIQ